MREPIYSIPTTNIEHYPLDADFMVSATIIPKRSYWRTTGNGKKGISPKSIDDLIKGTINSEWVIIPSPEDDVVNASIVKVEH